MGLFKLTQKNSGKDCKDIYLTKSKAYFMNQTAIQFKPIQKNSNLCYFLYVEKALDAFSISMLVKSSLL